jgi:hypothetical protein
MRTFSENLLKIAQKQGRCPGRNANSLTINDMLYFVQAEMA